ncbi:MAG: CotH kinase family protein [Abditibacteriota bacterium]|nr:CotH kinase family protein [Abditibacteriota bacterium]
MSKRTGIILLLPILAAVALFAAKFARPERPKDEIADHLSFAVRCGGRELTIMPWRESEKNYFVFLPAFADTEAVVSTADRSFDLDGRPLRPGDSLKDVKPETTYVLQGESGERNLITFVKSSKTAALFVDTQTGTLNRLHQRKENREDARITLVTSDGKVDYAGETDGRIGGRGNTTWVHAKKPYNLRLSSPASLLGMASARNYVLLSNPMDMSNLRNKTVLDFAGKTKLPYTPRCEFVDLYLNGNYRGLYLLTEKIDGAEGKPDLASSTDGLLFEVGYNVAPTPPYFTTKMNRVCSVSYPKRLTEERMNDAAEKVQSIENAFKNGAEIPAVFDLDSAVRRFLIDVIFINADGDRISSFYFLKGGKIYSGPVWDCDLSLGCALDEWTVALQNPERFEITGNWYPLFYKHPVFNARLRELYASEFRPLLGELLNKDFDAASIGVADSNRLNYIRWKRTYEGQNQRLCNPPQNSEEDIAFIRDFLEKRVKFLDSLWLK